MHLVRRSKDRADSVVIARDASGTIVRKIDSVPETWEIIADEEILRVCRERFDHRDKLANSSTLVSVRSSASFTKMG